MPRTLPRKRTHYQPRIGRPLCTAHAQDVIDEQGPRIPFEACKTRGQCNSPETGLNDSEGRHGRLSFVEGVRLTSADFSSRRTALA